MSYTVTIQAGCSPINEKAYYSCSYSLLVSSAAQRTKDSTSIQIKCFDSEGITVQFTLLAINGKLLDIQPWVRASSEDFHAKEFASSYSNEEVFVRYLLSNKKFEAYFIKSGMWQGDILLSLDMARKSVIKNFVADKPAEGRLQHSTYFAIENHVNMLLLTGDDVNQQDENGCTFLHKMKYFSETEPPPVLDEVNFDYDLDNNEGVSVMDLIMIEQCKEQDAWILSATKSRERIRIAKKRKAASE